MLEDELEKIWQNSTKEVVVHINSSELLINLNSQLKSFDKSINNRDRREIIASVIIILMFGTGAIFLKGILSKIGLWLGVLCGVLVIYVLKNAKKNKPDNYSLSVKEYLIKHRQYLVRERNLLDNVMYWYLIPPFISIVLFLIGRNMGTIILIISILIVFILYVYIYFLNKWEVKKVFNPLIEKVDEAIKDFETIDKTK